MQKFRTFIAVPLPPGIAAGLADLVRRVAETADGVRWVPVENLHLTLKFLGDVENTEVSRVCDIAYRAAELEPFAITFGAAGVLPSRDRPRVLTVDIDDPTDSLARLVDRLEIGYADMGFKRESRDYVPHITLGRARSGARRIDQSVVTPWLETRPAGGDEMMVDTLEVVSSFLAKRGAEYQVLDTIDIGLDEDDDDAVSPETVRPKVQIPPA